MKFLKLENGQLNNEFIEKYVYYLNLYSKTEFLKNFLKLYSKELSDYNVAIYKDNSKTDKVNRTGAGYFVYDDSYLLKRAELIRSRINSTNLAGLDISYTDDILKFEEYGKIYPFPVIARTIECQLEKDEKKYFLYGSMSFYLKSSCKKIEINTFSNEKKIFQMKENITMADEEDFNLIKSFKNLSDHEKVIRVNNETFKVVSNIDLLENIVHKDLPCMIILNKKYKFE